MSRTILEGGDFTDIEVVAGSLLYLAQQDAETGEPTVIVMDRDPAMKLADIIIAAFASSKGQSQ